MSEYEAPQEQAVEAEPTEEAAPEMTAAQKLFESPADLSDEEKEDLAKHGFVLSSEPASKPTPEA